MKRKALLSALSVLAVGVASAVESMSNETFVFLRPEESSFWRTATNAVVTLPIDYPEGASSATLTVRGLKYERVVQNLTAPSFDLALPTPTSPETENVYDLTLEFDNGTERSAQLGLIQGLLPDAEGATRCLAPAGGMAWNRTRSRAVLPIPYGTETFSVTVNGQQRVYETGLDGAQGWYALGGIRRHDTVALACVTNGVTCQATLLGIGDGLFTINFR